MNTRIFLLGIALLCSSAGFAQHTETIVLKKEANQGQTIIEIKEGRILVDGQEVSTYPKGNNEVAKRIVIDAANDAPGNMDWQGFEESNSNRALLGVLTRADKTPGALITEVKRGSAAEKAGLKAGDRILAIDESGIESPDALVQKIGDLKAGDEVTVRYRRDGKTANVKATLQAAPQESYGRRQSPFSGGQMPNYMPFNPGEIPFFSPEDLEGVMGHFRGMNRGPKLGIGVEERQDSKGILINSVSPGSPADKAGLRAGDVVTHWNGNVISNIQTLQQQVQGAKTGKNIEVRFQRDGKAMKAQVLLAAPVKKAEL